MKQLNILYRHPGADRDGFAPAVARADEEWTISRSRWIVLDDVSDLTDYSPRWTVR